MTLDTSKNAELDIEKGTRLQSIIRQLDFYEATPEELADPNGPGHCYNIPSKTKLA